MLFHFEFPITIGYAQLTKIQPYSIHLRRCWILTFYENIHNVVLELHKVCTVPDPGECLFFAQNLVLPSFCRQPHLVIAFRPVNNNGA
jgi:hypothetical protein